jgi:hypothetical protein
MSHGLLHQLYSRLDVRRHFFCFIQPSSLWFARYGDHPASFVRACSNGTKSQRATGLAIYRRPISDSSLKTWPKPSLIAVDSDTIIYDILLVTTLMQKHSQKRTVRQGYRQFAEGRQRKSTLSSKTPTDLTTITLPKWMGPVRMKRQTDPHD